MSRTLTSSDRKTLIRLASTLPKGSEERKAILAGLEKTATNLMDNSRFSRLVRLLRQATDRNDHNAAVKWLAQEKGFVGAHELVNVMDAIITIADYEGGTPRDLVKVRNKVLKALLAVAKSKVTDEEYQALYMSF